MAVNKRANRNAYTPFGSPYGGLSPEPITSDRNPTSSDTAELGTIWINKSSNQAYVITSVVAGSATWSEVSNISLPVSIANGGTNATSMASTNGTVIFDGTRLVTVAPGTAGHVLTSNGASAPTFQAVAGGGGSALVNYPNVTKESVVTYWTPGGGFQTTEDNAQFPAPTSGTLGNLSANVYSNPDAGSTIYTVRVNGADTAVVLTVASLATGYFANTVNTVAVVAGDLISLRVNVQTISPSAANLVFTIS